MNKRGDGDTEEQVQELVKVSGTIDVEGSDGVQEIFDLSALLERLTQGHYSRVILQFVDDYLVYCVDIYAILRAALPSTTQVYITADSSWGSSADDVSALHVDGEVLVFFGDDLSASSSHLDVIVVPKLRQMDLPALMKALTDAMELEVPHSEIARGSYALLYEPGLYWAALRLSALSLPGNTVLAKLPPQANLHQLKQTNPAWADLASVGGLLLPRDLLQEPQTTLVYIGDREEQLNRILLQYSNLPLLHYSPFTQSIAALRGGECKQLYERYGGIAKVKDCQTFGIIVGSMGISADLAKAVVSRLQTLLSAAGKKFYTFVMGRINEAKLGNFPEVLYSTILLPIIMFSAENIYNPFILRLKCIA